MSPPSEPLVPAAVSQLFRREVAGPGHSLKHIVKPFKSVLVNICKGVVQDLNSFLFFFIFFSLVYSNALQESANSILYNGLIEELVDVLQITDKQLMV